MIINEIYQVDILKLDHQGRGIGKIIDKVIFIPNALIGEKVEVSLTVIKKRYLEGQIINIINQSDKRLDPICPHFTKCGGCDLMHMSYDDQLAYKQNKIKEICSKFAKINPLLIADIIKCDNIYNYRNKVTLQVDNKIGFFKKKTNDIIGINKCLISDERINSIIVNLNNLKSLNNINEIVIRVSKNTNEAMIIFYTNGEINEKEIIDNFHNKVTSIIKYDESYKTLYGKPYITERMNELQFIISPSSFFQINTSQAIKLYETVLMFADLKGPETIVDLFCGTGTIGLYLSRFCKQVLGVEINNDAIKNAIKNKELNNIKNIDFICGDISKIINNLEVVPDIIILDPPRNGLDDNIINYLKKDCPNKIIYVSCDPVTLARDLEKMAEKYNVLEIIPIDMFANTYHVETVVLMTRLDK